MTPRHKYPKFIDNPAFIDMDTHVPEVDQLKAMLSNLTRIHLLTADKFDSFDALIHEYLISGIEVFGLETGIVSQINEELVYQICDVISPLEILHKGMEFPLEDTYCQEVYNSQTVLGFPEVGKLDYMNCHPVYQNLKLESYLSAPIFVEDKLFGTLNFTSTKPRQYGFSRHEHDLIMLMANSIGAYILLRQKEDKLLELNNKMKRFIGYVAHDLRNPLGRIIGYSKIARKLTCSSERRVTIIGRICLQAESALELVTTILEAAALNAGKISLNPKAVSVKALINPTIESVLPFAQDSAVEFNLTGDLDDKVICDTDRIQQSLNNLLINSIKYSPKEKQVLITVSKIENACSIKISNYVNSTSKILSQEHKEVYGSIGFGLDIVKEVMDAHQCEIKQTEEDGIYSVEFMLPIAS